MNILFMAHSGLRWLILLVAAVAIVKFALGWLQGSEFKGMDRGLASGFSGLIDLQTTLGIIFLIWDGLANTGFPMHRIEHGVMMIVAAFAGHLSSRWKNAADNIRFRNSLFLVGGVLVIIFVGVARLPGGWSR